MMLEETKRTLCHYSKQVDQALKKQYLNPKTLKKLNIKLPFSGFLILLWPVVLGYCLWRFIQYARFWNDVFNYYDEFFFPLKGLFVSSFSWWVPIALLWVIQKKVYPIFLYKFLGKRINMGFVLHDGDHNNEDSKDFPILIIWSNYSRDDDSKEVPFSRRYHKYMPKVSTGDIVIMFDSKLGYGYFIARKKGELPAYRWDGQSGSYVAAGNVAPANDLIKAFAEDFNNKINLWRDYLHQSNQEKKSNTFNVLQSNKQKDEELVRQKWAQVYLDDSIKQTIIDLGDAFNQGKAEAALGLLLYGPPGTGKSFIAKTLAETLNCGFMAINLYDLKGRYIGESSEKVQKIWQKAKSYPRCILFIDECESVFVKRGSRGSDSFTDDIVQAFIAEWDGFSKQNTVLILGATNRRDIMDEAVLSRFAEQIEIPLPDAPARLAILRNELSKSGVTEFTLPEDSADYLQGFSGRDIANLARQLVRSEKPINEALLMEMTQSKRTNANARVDKNATWDRLILSPAKKKELTSVCTMLNQAEILQQKNINIPKGILLYGPPGTGKTQIARTMANESGLSFMAVTTADIKAGYTGQSGQLVKDVFDRARSQSPCILFIDELDIIAPGRDSGSGDQDNFTREIVGQLLQELDGVKAHAGNVFVLAATNYPDKIDSAILSRFTRRIGIDLPNEEERIMLLKVLLEQKPLAFDLDENSAELVSMSVGASGRDLRNWVDSAEQSAIMRHIDNNDLQNLHIQLEDFIKTTETRRPDGA